MAGKIPKARQAFYAVLAAAVIFGGAELVFRLRDFKFYYNFSADLLGMPLLDMSRFRRIANQTVEFDRSVFWKFKPNQMLDAKGVYLKPVRINNYGFRGPDFQMEKRPGSYRIICLGDSVTFGWSAGEDETYPARLEKILQEKYPGCKIQVLNLGVTGYTSFQGKELFFTFAQKLEPDLVITSFGANDRYPALLSDQEHYDLGWWQANRMDLILRHSQVYKLLKAGVIYLKRRGQGLSLNPQTYLSGLKRKVSEREYGANIKMIKDECGRIGCGLILLNDDFPGLAVDPAFDALKDIAGKYNAKFPADWQKWDSLKVNQAVSARLGLPLIDLRRLFTESEAESDNGLMVDQGHPNKSGHEIIALSLQKTIADQPGFKKFLEKCPSKN